MSKLMGFDASGSSEQRKGEWLIKYSKSKPGKHYYYYVKTGQCTWTRPPGLVSEEHGEGPSKSTSVPETSSSNSKKSSKRKSDVKVDVEQKRPKADDPVPADCHPAGRTSTRNVPRQVESQSKMTKRKGPSQAPNKFNTVTGEASQPSDGGKTERQREILIPKKRLRKKSSKGALSDNNKNAIINHSSLSSSTSQCSSTTVPARNSATVHQTNRIASENISGSQSKTSPTKSLSSHRKKKTKQMAQKRLTELQVSLKKQQHNIASKNVCSSIDPGIVERGNPKIPQYTKNPEIVQDYTIVQEYTRNPEIVQGYTRSPEIVQGYTRNPEIVQEYTRDPEVVEVHKKETSQKEFCQSYDSKRFLTTEDYFQPSDRHFGPAETRLRELQSNLKEGQKLKQGAGLPAPSSDIEAMEIEFMESEVLFDIEELRQKEGNVNQDSRPIFMDIDMECDGVESDPKSIVYIVLDTNILLSHLTLTAKLLKSRVSGKGPAHIFIPWQVLQELDNLKDRGKPGIQPVARQAINFLHGKFVSKHPRVRGQKMSEGTKDASSCADDNILQSCLQLIEQRYDVILASNDTNLRNKALVSDVVAVSKDQLVAQISDDKTEDDQSAGRKAVLREKLSPSNKDNSSSCNNNDYSPLTLPEALEKDERGRLVFMCFEAAHNAAANICQAKSLLDLDHVTQAKGMIEAVRKLVHLLNILLVMPIVTLTEDHPVLNELTSLIKGDSSITPKDVILFFTKDCYRVLIENGITQFSSFEMQLGQMLQGAM